MAIIALSDGLTKSLLDTTSLKGSLDAGEIRIFTGGPPTSANDAESGDLLVIIKSDAGDSLLDFAAAVLTAGVITKDLTQIWSGIASQSGTAGYYRFTKAADGGGSSTTIVRFQGNVSTSGAALNMSSVEIVVAATQTIDTYIITQPSS